MSFWEKKKFDDVDILFLEYNEKEKKKFSLIANEDI